LHRRADDPGLRFCAEHGLIDEAEALIPNQLAPEPQPGSGVKVGTTVKPLGVHFDVTGKPFRLLVQLMVTLAILGLAIAAIVTKTSVEAAWGAVGLVAGYWLR
jgi:hypothetical protein